MSSFSSVVRKTGASIKPKVQPRRNVPRRKEQSPLPESHVTHDAAAGLADQVQGRRKDGTNPLSQEEADPLTTNEGTTQQELERSIPEPQPLPTVHIAKNPRLRSNRSSVHDATQPLHPRNQSSVSTKNVAKSSNGASIQHLAATSTTTNASHLTRQISSESEHTEYASIGPSKRRRLTPQPPVSPAPSVPIEDSLNVAPPVRNPSQPLNEVGINGNQPAVDLIRSATERAASVSNLANDIERQTRARSLQSTGPLISHSTSDRLLTENEQSFTPESAARNRKKKSAAEQAAEVIANIVGGSGDISRGRKATPDGAEDYELEPDQVTMAELVQDRKLGKKSQLEEDMQRDWVDIVRRRKEARDLALENAQKGRKRAFGGTVEVLPQVTVALGPRTEVRNGRIVVIEESRQIDRNGALEQAAVLDAENVREDKFYYKRVNQNTVGLKASSGRKFRWDEEATEKFFWGLQMFGTDFLMIANMFPGLDRKQVKMKFIREENADKVKVREALANRISIDLEEYAKLTETTLQDPKDLQAEIDAEEQRLKEEDHQQRIREGFINSSTADNPIPTTEGEDPDIVDGTTENASRFSTVAEEIMAPKKRQRKTGSTLRKRGPKAGRRPAEGIEEMLGSIDEVRV